MTAVTLVALTAVALWAMGGVVFAVAALEHIDGCRYVDPKCTGKGYAWLMELLSQNYFVHGKAEINHGYGPFR